MSAERQFFGTDGVRGPYGGPLVNEAFFARLACAAGEWVKAQRDGTRGTGSPAAPGLSAAGKRVLIGRDTRSSGGRLTQAVIAGLRVAGLEPVDLGVLPTPAVARAVKVDGAPLGVVITASHNPAGDNGIKFFKRGGLKLSDEEEARIEALFDQSKNKPFTKVFGSETQAGFLFSGSKKEPAKALDVVPPSEQALAKAWEDEKLMGPIRDALADTSAARQSYIAAMARLLPTGVLRGWHLVLDAANGATWLTSLTVLSELGAEVVELGNNPGGENINLGCGSEHPQRMVARVRSTGARLGIAHDGDGDRCVLCDELGEVLDGDEILTLLALHALREGRLAADTLVVTVQSNLGVDAAVAAAGGRVVRTPVGDRHVAERMRAEGATLGGESSGHIICSDVSPTGDGLVAALRVIRVMLATGRPLSELRRALVKFPQATATVMARVKPPLETLPALTAAIAGLEAELGSRGRVLARWSGTEPKLRLLVEGPDAQVVKEGLARLVAAARQDLPEQPERDG